MEGQGVRARNDGNTTVSGLRRTIKYPFESIIVDAARLAYQLKKPDIVLGISRGGIIIGYELARQFGVPFQTVAAFSDIRDLKGKKVVLADDIYDTGTTIEHFRKQIPDLQVAVLYCSPGVRDVAFVYRTDLDSWIVFPWEREQDQKAGVEQAVVSLLRYIGEDPLREGLKETPKRFVKAMAEMTSGYKLSPDSVLKTFDAEGYSQMIVIKDIPFNSLCEHHLLGFSGFASVAYIPKKKIVGLSKIPRVVEMFAQRLQVQERLTQQVADTLWDKLRPEGVGVRIQASHSCMRCRGIKKPGTMLTTALKGSFLTDSKVKSEFLQAV